KLLSIQYAKRQATPFFNKLKGLKMNFRDVQNLVPEVRNKLQQYKAFSKQKEELIRLIGQYYLQSADPKVSTDELNFVFTLGMSYANVEPFKVEEVEENG
ncbi:MAG: TIGR02556 family CRISPR-associated protein, partial [Pseudothermotoga sp.]|nr:TIGR02556 family CRISPR-associated protein [Pseudothermotoga sp.]